MEWIDVKDALPEQNEKVLFHGKGGNVYFGTSQGGDRFTSFDKYCTIFSVTHWMPLPKPFEPQLKELFSGLDLTQKP